MLSEKLTMEKFSHVDFYVCFEESQVMGVIFYLNNEILSELDMSTWEKHMKRSLLLWLHKKIIIAPFCIWVFSKKLKNTYQIEMIWYLIIGVNIINRTYYDHFLIQNFSSGVEKYITHSLHSLEIFFNTRREFFMSAWLCNYIFSSFTWILHVLND